jgi:phosphatidylserine/phosphatidylglycerophosphate/cardiolipin synthase-like enzyme
MSTKKLPVIDNTANNSVQKMFEQWFKETRCLKIATAFFEIGSLLALDGEWQKIDSIRILMGDEIAKRTRKELIAALKHQFDESIEQWKEKDDALTGLFAIREALSNHKIEFRVFTKSKFHAKCYLFENRNESYPSTALVGSSNFTRPGITQNIELNYRVTVDSEVEFLSDWFEEHWEKAEKNFVPELIEMVERQIKLYTPFTVYTKALHEFFEGKEIPLQKWEEEESALYTPVIKQISA